MREKLKSLPLTELKQIAKENHIKNVSTLRKAQLIDVILEKLSPESAQTTETESTPTSDTNSSESSSEASSNQVDAASETENVTATAETDSTISTSETSGITSSEGTTTDAQTQAPRERRYTTTAPSYAAARNNFYSRNNSYSSSSFKDLRQSNTHSVHPRKPRVRNDRTDANWREDSIGRFNNTRNDAPGRYDNSRNDLTNRYDNTRSDNQRFDNRNNDTQNRFDASRNDSSDRFDNGGREYRSDFSSRNTFSNRYDSSRNDYSNRYNNTRNDYSNRFDASREGLRSDSMNRFDNNRNEFSSRYDNTRNDYSARNDVRNDVNYSARNDFNRPDSGNRFDSMNRSDAPIRTDSMNRFSARTDLNQNDLNRNDLNRNDSIRSDLSNQNRFDTRSDATNRTDSVNRFDTAIRDDFANRFDNDGALPEGCQPDCGILDVLPEGFGFLRSANFLSGQQDVYVAPSQIRRFGMKTGDMVDGFQKPNSDENKYDALIRINTINGFDPELSAKRPNFEDLTPVFPDSRLSMEVEGGSTALRIVDLISPIGKGQRGMIVSPPKAGKTTLLKELASAVTHNYPDMHLIILLIDERPEEVTDIRESIQGEHVEVIYSTFDETPEHHKQVAEMVLERAKRLVEHKQDVMILLDSITRLARAYNLTVTPSGRTLSGGLDPAALHMPKKFFGAARNMREGGSLTILATALVDTGSRLDDMVFEEFKGTGNMELVLDRKLSERRIFPAIDITRSGTRREDLLLTPEESAAVATIRRSINGLKNDKAIEQILNHFVHTKNNAEFIATLPKVRP